MKYLVTGGAGFVGSHLVDYLLSMDNKVVVVDDLSLGRMENIQHNFDNPDFKFYKTNLLDEQKMEMIFNAEMFGTVFHLAANSDIAVSYHKPEVDLNKTFLSSYIVLKYMKNHDVKNIIFASTSAIYGNLRVLLSEDSGPLLPISHYGAAKLASEAFISSFVENYNFKAWIIRFPNIVGERATHGVIFDLINKLRKNPDELEVLGNGEQYKPYLYVKDLVEAIIFVRNNSNEKVNIYNIGVDSRTRVKEIVQMIIEEIKLTPKIKYTGGSQGWVGDVPEFSYDLSKIHALGWSAKVSSNEAVRKAIRYILAKDKI